MIALLGGVGRTGLFLLGLGVVVVFLVLVELIAQFSHSSFFRTVLIGTDNRTSTSKTFVLMWTLLVAWALASLFMAGEVASQHPCSQAINATTHQNDLNAATTQCEGIRDHVGLMQIGWFRFIMSGLDGGYLVLLGIPAAAAIGAKAVTQSKVNSGSISKTPAPQATQTVATRLSQIFSSDDGSTDLADFQYMFFNLLAAGYFVARILGATGEGLPHIADTLLGLTSVSAALYVGKKVATRSQPMVLSVFPSVLVEGQPFMVTGTNLTSDPSIPAPQQPPGLINPKITVNGDLAVNIVADPVVADRLTAVAPTGLLPAGSTAPIAGTVEVLTAYGYKTPGYAVSVSQLK